MEESKELVVVGEPAGNVSIFSTIEKFELAQRVAAVFASSDMVPAHYRKKPSNVLIAMNMAERMGLDPFMVMGKTYIIKGKIGIEATLAIALINSSGKFEPLQYKFNEAKTECFAYAKSVQTGGLREGSTVSLKMAKDEGWGAKWRTLPELMLQYRSAVFFARVYCPEAIMGLYTKDELIDIDNSKGAKNVTPETPAIEEPDVPEAVIAKTEVVNEKTETWDEFVIRKQLSKSEIKELDDYITASAESLNMTASALRDSAIQAGDLDDILEAVIADKKDEPASEPAKGNWWDSIKHWSFREKHDLKSLISFGFGNFNNDSKICKDNPDAYNVLKLALPETKKALVKKYDKMFGAGEFNKLLGVKND